MLTKEQKEKYLRYPGHCPHCGSYELSYEKVTFEANKVWHEISCSKCNKRWADIYSKKLSEKENIRSNEAKVIVDTIFHSMRESLEKGEGIEIRGFGSFVVRDYGGYEGRNPKTGKIVDVPPKKLPYFKVGKELKEMVNTGTVQK